MSEGRNPSVEPLLDVGAKRARPVGKGGRTVSDPRMERAEEPGQRTVSTTVKMEDPDREPDEGDDRTTEESAADAEAPPRAGVASGPTSTLGLTAAELSAALSDARAVYADLGGADKGSLWAALGLILSTFAPFVGVPGDPWRSGVVGGGWVLVALAVWSISLTGQRARTLGILGSGGADLTAHETSELRRISLLHLLCGALATGYATYFIVLHWKVIEYRTVTGEAFRPILRPGVFVALFFATGLAYAGLARFRADATRRRQRQS
ncbi:MAG: hypothetical protein AB2A00_42270 [Myxococcota bacterium]